MTSTFDLNAAQFERHRAFPQGVPEAIRQAIWESTAARPSDWLLDLGAGSGRIGRAFVEAGDSYLGVDFSLAMLREFRARDSAAYLFQADGGFLPFRDHSFGLVLLMQVLSGAHNWQKLLGETKRVTSPGGWVVVGQTATPADGVDVRMKKQLMQILKQMGAASHESKRSREESLQWLRTACSRETQVTAVSWTSQRTPREFMQRHRSGARFSSLPGMVQDEALQKLSVWANTTYGSLNDVFSEKHSFDLHLFRIGVS